MKDSSCKWKDTIWSSVTELSHLEECPVLPTSLQRREYNSISLFTSTLFIGEHLCGFHILATMNNIRKYTQVHIFL